MDEIRKEINNLIDNLENTNQDDRELFIVKLLLINNILKTNNFIGLSYIKRYIGRLQRIRSKNNGFESKFNNFKKFFSEITQ